MRSRSALAVAALSGALLLAGCATTAGGLGTADSVLRGATATNSVSLSLTPGEVKTGEQLWAEVSTTDAGYLYVYQLGTDGKSVGLVFPNAIDAANYLAPGRHKLPRPGWRMTARGPAGVGYFVAVVAARQQDLLAIDARARQGLIEIDGPYAAAMSPVRELSP